MNHETLRKILDLARWAPSGDNTQPWRFEIVDGLTVRIHGFDTRNEILYDFEGHASHIAHGALLETVRIAASRFNLSSEWRVLAPLDERNPVYEVRFASNESVLIDPLADYIETRTVQRRPMLTTPLSTAQRQALVAAAGPTYKIQLFETAPERWRIAWLLWDSAKIRLTCPEAYPAHKSIIEWRARFSKDRIPEQAVGVDPATARLMEWALISWTRVDFLNRYLLGTVAPRILLDLLPGYFCAAHLLVRPLLAPSQMQDWVQAGMAWQRIWLTVTHLGLHFQPQMTPVIFRWYARAGKRFSADESLFTSAQFLADKFEQIVSAQESDSFSFFGRVGISQTPDSRSLRLDLTDLMKPE